MVKISALTCGRREHILSESPAARDGRAFGKRRSYYGAPKEELASLYVVAIQPGGKAMNNWSETEEHIRGKVRMVTADERLFGVLSTGERIAVALVLDRYDLLDFWGSMLEAVERLGIEWTQAALRVQRDGWDV